jgi:hypothetical protein
MTSSAPVTPVYVPYATLISALDTLRTHGIPRTGKIDKSIWDSQSGTIQAQLILAFRFLGLIDDQKTVLPALPPLVAASAEERKPLLKKLIEDKYRDIVSLDLTTISQGQLDEAFRKFDINGSTLTRATRFFVKACSELGIPMAKRFSERARPVGSPKRKKAANGSKSPDVDPGDTNPMRKGNTTWEERLLEKFPTYDPTWSDELKTKWFEGFERLMKAKE